MSGERPSYRDEWVREVGLDRARAKLLVLLPGLGALAVASVARVELARRRLAGPLLALDQFSFGAWDVTGDDASRVAERSNLLTSAELAAVRPALAALRPRPGVHDPDRVRRVRADHVATVRDHRHAIQVLRGDIREMEAETRAARAVMVCTMSTETLRGRPAFADAPDDLERALDRNDRGITPTMLYAYAALAEGIPFANATPNRAAGLRAFQQLAVARGVPISGRDHEGPWTAMTVLGLALRLDAAKRAGWRGPLPDDAPPDRAVPAMGWT